MCFQSDGNLSYWNFGTPKWESQNKKPFGCGPRGEPKNMLYGGRWWLPLSSGHGESCEFKVVRGCPSTKGVPESDLTNWVVGLMHVRVSN
jgi:hypothetical protein